MTLKAHSKHTALARPASGNFHRNEWAIVGAPCITIKVLAGKIIGALSPRYKVAYADTSHDDDASMLPGRLANGAGLEYTDQISYRQLNFQSEFNAFKLRESFAGTDLVLVNGNHHQATKQVVIIDDAKRSSLQKRISQLTDVKLILLAGNTADVFDFVKESLSGWQDIPLYHLDETEKIITFFEGQMELCKPALNGLVLAGGKSQRMGFDKGAVNWYGKEQRYYVADLLKPVCHEVFISCRPNQEAIDPQYPIITDTFTGLGPYGAILSAFREKPDTAWLVVACDLPLMDASALEHLIAQRNTSSVATAYISAFDGMPEPLITIWEPKSYPVLLSFLSQGYSCPRKVLINSDCTLIEAPHPDALTNVNTPEELERVKRLIHQKIAAAL